MFLAFLQYFSVHSCLLIYFIQMVRDYFPCTEFISSLKQWVTQCKKRRQCNILSFVMCIFYFFYFFLFSIFCNTTPWSWHSSSHGFGHYIPHSFIDWNNTKAPFYMPNESNHPPRQLWQSFSSPWPSLVTESWHHLACGYFYPWWHGHATYPSSQIFSCYGHVTRIEEVDNWCWEIMLFSTIQSCRLYMKERYAAFIVKMFCVCVSVRK